MTETPEEITVIITEAETEPVRLNVNGQSAVVMLNVEATIPAVFKAALDGAALTYRLDGAPGEAIAEAQEAEIEISADFDAEAIIAGTLDDILPQIDALASDQLDALRRAEADREKPRKGLTDAIDKLIADRASTPA